MTIEDAGKIKRILFIENKANYSDFISKNRDSAMMTIYLGGFYSPLRKVFIKKLYEAVCGHNAEFYHWGDIDLGGFLIFNKLKTNIIAELKPYLMDTEALVSKMKYAVQIDDKYAAKLYRLFDNIHFEEFKDVIGFMLENKVKLEQEAFLL